MHGRISVPVIRFCPPFLKNVSGVGVMIMRHFALTRSHTRFLYIASRHEASRYIGMASGNKRAHTTSTLQYLLVLRRVSR